MTLEDLRSVDIMASAQKVIDGQPLSPAENLALRSAMTLAYLAERQRNEECPLFL